jgi:PadR family transcriptional regulator, regulatory protein PadR
MLRHMAAPDRKLITREILLGFWKVHILYHAGEEPVVGQWMLGELRQHGYDISPGTLYPLLKRMERNGWLKCEVEAGAGPRARRHYHLTREGRGVLDVVLDRVGELHQEVMSDRARSGAKRPRARSATGKRSSARGRRGLPRT